ncbi:hypothetical protein ACLBKU_13950 [Erythrobacter sp. NE805]|uniref:hypothetical protein n=1 Tax=Erythrobacter sp. NE805 TaxID=3389875 RepID=UPI00396B44D9
MTRAINPQLTDSEAARMLSTALAIAARERGLSLRKIAPLVGYKQAVVLSHMATGRVPIPVEKAETFAKVLDMDAGQFLKAILKQRHPTVSWALLNGDTTGKELSFEQGLAAGLGGHTSALNEEQLAVVKEVAADPSPRRRWLSAEEAAAVEIFRRARRDEGDVDKAVRDYTRLGPVREQPSE